MTTNTTDLCRRFIQALPSSCSLGQVKISLFFNCLSTHWDDIICGINIDPFEGIQDSLAFRIPYGYWKYQSLLVELGLWTPIFSGIPDSLSCILDSKSQDSGFFKQNNPGFQNPKLGNSSIRVPYMRRINSTLKVLPMCEKPG